MKHGEKAVFGLCIVIICMILFWLIFGQRDTPAPTTPSEGLDTNYQAFENLV